MDDRIASIVSILDCSEDAARSLLDIAGGDTEQAIQLWFNDEELQRNLTAPETVASGSASASAATASGRRSTPSRPATGPGPARPSAARTSLRNEGRLGCADARGVIHLDSDSDDNEDNESVFDMDSDSNVDADGTASAALVARNAQEEEDAAMARRMQEELYGGASAGAGAGEGLDLDADGVRAPMARTTETLVDPIYGSYDEDGRALFLAQRAREAAMRSQSNNPFAQSLWTDPSANADNATDRTRPDNEASASSAMRRQNRLAELFRPPHDLITHLSVSEARDMGKEKNRWLLVNLQDMAIFQCQALNRDLWSDKAVKQLVSENFIFLQYDKSDPLGEMYIGFYMPNPSQHENPANYPHVGIIDPRTGEQVKLWAGSPFPSAAQFHADLVEFLDRYSLDINSKNPVTTRRAPAAQASRAMDVDRMTEEEMLEMALKNSLETDFNGNGNNGSSTGVGSTVFSKPTVHDPDALTTRLGDDASDSKDAVMTPASPIAAAEAGADEEAASEERRLFAGIASDRPQAEPTETNPAITTRIQFRHPTGRVIRRFRLDDPVRRIYEWLKASPLAPDKEGVEFELKVQRPEGGNLIHELDKTITESNLKQGTVMIEFLED